MSERNNMALPFSEEILKRCTVCKEMKQRADFYPRKDGADGRTSRCKRCHNQITGPQSKVWRLANPDRVKANDNARYSREKDAVLLRYGNACVCCGEARRSMLEIDHVHNDGYAERKRQINRIEFYRRLARASEKDNRYQLLCSNCNRSKARNGGSCEHLTEEVDLLMAMAP